MLGFYDYTMVLTYMSLLSAGLGIFTSLSGHGHPYVGTFFLLFCGLCDAFDGKVARTKKDRTEEQCKFGIQIDSLSDLVAFGVLPACIGLSMLWKVSVFSSVPRMHTGNALDFIAPVLCFMVMMLYVLAAMIRLAYFNVQEEIRQKEEGGVRKYYQGLPVTSASLIFPLVMLLQFLTPKDLTLVYFGVMVVVGFLFLYKFKVKKPGLKGLLGLVLIGAIEFAIMIICKFVWNH